MYVLAAWETKDSVVLCTSLLSLFVSVGVAVWTRWNVEVDIRETRRIERTWNLVSGYFAPGFFLVRSAVYDIKASAAKLPEEKEMIARYLVGEFDPADPMAPERRPDRNGLFPLQNLSTFISFWHQFVVLSRRGLLDEKMIAPLQDEIRYCGEFLEELAEACEKCESKQEPLPDWVGPLSGITAWAPRRKNRRSVPGAD
jgi:hypothetical protein